MGGNPLKTPFATFYKTNIISTKKRYGNFTDEQLARAIRHNVNTTAGHGGFYDFNGMSDEDISAVISYLRSTPPMHKLFPSMTTHSGKGIITFFNKTGFNKG